MRIQNIDIFYWFIIAICPIATGTTWAQYSVHKLKWRFNSWKNYFWPNIGQTPLLQLSELLEGLSVTLRKNISVNIKTGKPDCFIITDVFRNALKVRCQLRVLCWIFIIYREEFWNRPWHVQYNKSFLSSIWFIHLTLLSLCGSVLVFISAFPTLLSTASNIWKFVML